MRLAITGTSGFVGTHLLQKLAQHSIVQLKHKQIMNNASGTPEQLLHALLHETEACIHLAGRAHIMKDSGDNPYQAYLEANVTYTKLLAEAAVSAGVKRFIYISSIKVNGEGTFGTPFTADDRPNPQDDYGKTKLLAEQALLELHEQGKIEVVIIRPPLIYGPDVKGNLATLSKAIEKRIPLPLTGIKDNKRNLVALDNLCDLIEACLVHPNAAGEIFLVSDDQTISTSQLCELIAQGKNTRLIGLPIPVALLKFASKLTGKTAAVSRLIGDLEVDITKNKELLDWQPIDTTEKLLPKAFL
ncbi:hypothetical protein C9I89_16005 [Photobacterium lipolyticum]|uniref:NAD-dependent epimerase/dehydratase domain-containing protein n=2 Tax=Photobacterium lipolyticum TaxID=266810 RepID=A0A2T3MVJ2_9GAMM|nr:hypothetical protein C9I89_16005 [Photobacterium lipolyticum]